MDIKRKYIDYLNNDRGAKKYNAFKKILYGEGDSLVITIAPFLVGEITKNKIAVLDIGGGDGKRLAHVVILLNQCNIFVKKAVLVEPSEVFLKNAEKNLKNIKNLEIVNKKFEEYESGDGFDLILLIHSIFTFTDKEYLKKIIKLTKPGGLIVIVSNNIDSFLAHLKSVVDKNYRNKRKEISDVLDDIKSFGLNYKSRFFYTIFPNKNSDFFNDNEKLILEWLSLNDFDNISEEIKVGAKEIFSKFTVDGKIKEEEILLLIKK